MADKVSDLFSNLSLKEKQILLRAAEFASFAFEMSPALQAQRDERVDARMATSSTRLNLTDW